jgi:SAM-dependent methyltransferase
MMSDWDTVADLYDSAPDREWARLDERRIEFGVTLRALEEFLPPAPAEVIDIGSGPGRYAIPLASQGYSLSLLDLSAECLKLAEAEAVRAGVSFERVELGNATQLRAFPDSSFDAALLLGPLYHLKAGKDRAEAVSEALRVLRPGGVLFSAFLSRYSVVRYAAKTRPEQVTGDPRFIKSILAEGVGESSRPDAVFLNSCYFADPMAVQPFMESHGVNTLAVLGCEGVVAEVEGRLNDLSPADLAEWVDLNYSLGSRPELLAASAHVLHVGRRT